MNEAMKLLLAICFGLQITLVTAFKAKFSKVASNKLGVQDSQATNGSANPFVNMSANVPVSVSELTTVLVATACVDYICSDGWVPKLDHGLVQTVPNANKDAECCLKTCELFVQQVGCPSGFLSNPAYYRNVEFTSQMCCDRQCRDEWQCQEVGYRTRGHDARGHSISECCGATCSIYECPTDWKSASDSTVTFADKPADCCNQTCTLFECANGTEKYEDAASSSISFTQEYCCLDQCSIFSDKCPSGFGVPHGSKNDTQGNIDSCCKEECKHHTCATGWDANLSKALHFGNTNEECCTQTCALHQCEDMFANSTNPAKLASYNITDESCCEASCKAYTCSGGWLQNETMIAEAGNTDEICCSKTCGVLTCPVGRRTRPNDLINESLAESEDFCCEPEECAAFDNLTSLTTTKCSDLNQDECESKYAIFNETNNTALIRCMWRQLGSTNITTCRTWGTAVYDCTASM